MHIIINNSSMIPIYEQLIDQIKASILNGSLTSGSILPSVRNLSKELRISALTVKKAYDILEEDGFTITVHGKGTFVAQINKNLLKEEKQKEFENSINSAIKKARVNGLSDEDIRNIFEIIMEG